MRGEERYRSSAMKVGDERETVLPGCRFGDHLRIWTKDGQGQMLRRHESAQLGGVAVPRKLDVNETDSNPVRPQTMSIDSPAAIVMTVSSPSLSTSLATCIRSIVVA